VLLTYTNCTRKDWACALLEMSVAAGALSMLVFTNDFWRDGPRAVPIIDTEVRNLRFLAFSYELRRS
jgi:hypothetical protein